MTRNAAIAAAAILVLALASIYLSVTLPGRGADRFAACRSGQIGGGDIGGPFTLVDETGATVTDADVITGPTILYFGYRFCPDVCPLDNARNAEAVELLEERGIVATPVFVTIDPERDDVAGMASYTDMFHPRMIGLTGSAEQIAAAARAYRVFYQKRMGEDPDFYLMDHSVFSYLALPGYGVVDFFNRDVTPEAMADRVACYVRAAAN
jgi:protein SCO1/2